MSKPAFTEGPWRTDEDCGHESVSGPDGAMVADCSIFVSPKFGERRTQTNRANARLIAAVPDMVEALQTARAFVVAELEQRGDCDKNYLISAAATLAAIDAALAKALGESSLSVAAE